MRLNRLKYWALALIMRRALSSESGFFGFLLLGFGLCKCLLLPSLRVQGSGVWEEHRKKVEVCLGLGSLESSQDWTFSGIE